MDGDEDKYKPLEEGVNKIQEAKNPSEAEKEKALRSPAGAYLYAYKVIKGRWPEAEPIIINSPWSALHYAQYVLKGRWPEAEPIIMQNPAIAYFYAGDVIKDRWLEAEPIIMSDKSYSILYTQFLDMKLEDILETNPILKSLRIDREEDYKPLEESHGKIFKTKKRFKKA
jgi:hypothetical protein